VVGRGQVVMKDLLAIPRDLVGLFVDDGSLAAVLVLWSALAWYALPGLPANAGWDGPILFLGYLMILAENLRRAALRHIQGKR